jgi:hypothetical protein
MTIRRRMVSLAIMAVICADVPRAQADWLLAAYFGGARTASNTLSVDAPSVDVRVGPVTYAGESWRSPIYYGWRVRRTSDLRPWIGFEVEFTHAKAIADVARVVSVEHDGLVESVSLATILPRLELSHGLNLALANVVVVRTLPWSNGRWALIGRGGIGLAIPHVEATIPGTSRDAYQLAGWAGAVGGGVEWRAWRNLYVVADVRISLADVTFDVGDTSIHGTFRTAHANSGVALRF